MQNGRAGRLHPAVGTARRHLAAALEKLLGAGSIKATGRSRTASTADAADLPLLLVACSGGPDSLALAGIAAHFARRGDVRVGAIIVDHGLQEDSAAVAAQTTQILTDLGLHPVITEKVQVPVGNMGPEMAARTAPPATPLSRKLLKPPAPAPYCSATPSTTRQKPCCSA